MAKDYMSLLPDEPGRGQPADNKGNTIMYRGVQKYLDGDLAGAKVDLAEAKRLGIIGNTNLAYAIGTIEREQSAMARLDMPSDASGPANYMDSLPGEEKVLSQTYKNLPATDPDHSAKIIDLARKTEQSEDFVEENLPEVEKAAQAKPSEFWRQVEKDYPGTTKWLYEGRNMAVAHDDVDNLGMRERLVADVGESMELLLDPGKRIMAADRAFRGTVSKAPVGFTSGTLQVRLSELGWQQLAGALSTGEHDPAFDHELTGIEKKLAEYYKDEPKFNPFYFAAQQTPNLMLMARKGAIRGMQGALVFGAGSMLFGAPGAAVAPAAFTAGGVVGGRIGAAEGMVILEGGAAYREFSKLKDKNGNLINPRLAAEMGLLVGVINSGLEYFSLVALLRTIPGGSRVLGRFMKEKGIFAGLAPKQAVKEAAKRYLTSILAEVGTEVAQEAVGVGVGEAGKALSGQPFEPIATEEAARQIGGVISPAAQATMLLGMPGTVVHIAGEINKFQQTDTIREAYVKLGEMAAESKLAERSPEALGDHLNSITKGTELQDIYIPADAFAEYCKKNDLDPKELAAKLGIDTLYQEAVETHGDMKIPSGDWAAKAIKVGKDMGRNIYQELTDDTKSNPEAYTRRQKDELGQLYQEQFTREAERIIKEDPAQEIVKQQESDRIYKELVEAGRPEKEAKASAELFSGIALSLSAQVETLTPEQASAALVSKIHGVEDIEAPVRTAAVTPDITETNIETARKKLYSTTKAEISAQPAYLASEYLRNKMGPGYRKIAINFMGEDKISKNNRFLFELAADAFGLGDAESLLKLISELPTREEAIKDMVELRLASTFGDPRLYQYANEQLTKAKEMFDEDKPADEIQQNTGWVNEDGQWRYSPGFGVFGPDALYQMAPPAAYDDELAKKAKAVFGLTKNLKEAGYILPDGTLLDFTGRHYAVGYENKKVLPGKPDYLKGHRAVDHRELHELDYSGTDGMIEFMKKSGAVRISADSGMINFEVPPTRKQLEVVKEIAEMNEGNVYIDFGEGRYVESPEGARPAQVIGGIKKFYLNKGILYQQALAPAFFSKLERTLEEKMPNAASTEQVKGILAGAGVKQDEIDWMGINEFLEGKAKVTKQEMLDFVRANNVQVKEVEKKTQISKKVMVQDIGSGRYRVHGPGMAPQLFDSQEEAVEEAERIKEGYGKEYVKTETKFAQWQLSGGEDYRELLLTLPVKRAESFETFLQYHRERYPSSDLSDAEIKKIYQTSAAMIPGQGRMTGGVEAQNFISQHYDEPNILAHVRFNDRVDAEGKRVLFLEEIQSDWHQKGRAEGYQKAVGTSARKAAAGFDEKMRLKYGGKKEAFNNITEGEMDERDKLYEAATIEERESSPAMQLSMVSDAPFKKTWHELALKRMLRYAAENGYDKLAWTTGEQQADRYDLSKQAKFIMVAKEGEGYYANGEDINDKVFELGNFKDENALAGAIGKDLASKAVAKLKKSPRAYFHDQDLKVGGEGMAGFYDKMLPAFLNKFVKKWGGRVREADVGLVKLEKDGVVSYVKKEDVSARRKAVPGVKDSVATVHSLEITPDMKEAALSEGFPMFQAAAGAFDPRTKDILLSFKKANASTFVHEMAHAWLTLVDEMVKDGRASESLITDHTKLMAWLGAEYDKPLTTAQQEKFAASFEAYLREGKAPTAELRTAFARFKRWLTLIYKSIRDIGAGILGDEGVSPEVRGIMDRMLATEDEIGAAEQIMDPASKMEFAWLDPKVQAKLDKLRQQAHDEAAAKLLKQQMAEIAEDRQAFLVSERQRITDEITETLKNDKLHLAIKGMADSEKAARTLAEAYIADELEEGSEGWLNFDVTAEMLDFYSGEELAKQIIAKPPFKQEVSEAVDARMNEAYADLKDTDAIRDEAMKAVHGDRQLEVLALERELLKSKVEDAQGKAEAHRYTMTKIWMEAEIAKARALEVVSKLKLGEIKSPEKYFTAERIAAVRVAKAMARKDYSKAAAHKHTQMLNHALGMAVIKTRKQIDKALEQIKKISKIKQDKLFTQETFVQVHQILFRFGFMNDSNRFAREETLDQYLKRAALAFQSGEGDESNPLNLPAWILDEGTRIVTNNLTTEQLTDVKDALQNIVHVARMTNRFYVMSEKESIGEMAGVLSDAAEKNLGKKKSGRAVERLKERFGAATDEYFFSLDTHDTVFNCLDGSKDFGMWYKTFSLEAKNAADKESARRWELIEKTTKIWSVYSRKEISEIHNKKLTIPEFGLDNANPLYKHQLLAMALNMGNETSEARLLDTRPVNFPEAFDWKASRENTKRVIMGVLQQHLDKRDWQFIQNVWNLVNGPWEEISALHKRVTGFEPKKVEAVPFEVSLPDGEKMTMEGGYYPLAEDPRFSEKAAEREMLSLPVYTDSNPGFRAMTKTGHTKPRTGAKYAVLLKLDLISMHLNDITHDLYFRELIIDLRRLGANTTFIDGVKSTAGESAYRYIDNWIKSVASGRNIEKFSLTTSSRMIRALDQRSVGSIIMANVAVLLQNFANPFLVGGRVEGFGHGAAAKAFFIDGLLKYYPKVALAGVGWKAAAKYDDWICSKSSYMRDRKENPAYTLQRYKGITAQMKKSPGEFFFGLLAGTDGMTVKPAWVAAYNQKLAETNNEKESINYADLLVSRVVPSGRKYDQPQIIRSGSDVDKIVTRFYSFWSVEYNNWAREMKKQGRQPIKNAPRFMGFVASRMMFVYTSALLAGHGPDPEWDFAKKIAWWAKEFAMYPISFFPFFRGIASLAIDKGLGLPSYGYRPLLMMSAVEDMGHAILKLKKRATGEVSDQEVVESLAKFASVAFPYPRQFNSWFFNAYDYITNHMEPAFKDIYRRRPVLKR